MTTVLRWMGRTKTMFIAACIAASFAQSASAQVPLGTAQAYGVLGGSTVTNTGPTVVTGDLGVSPGAAITGFPPGIVTGTIHAADAAALQAQTDAIAAYNFLATQPCGTPLSGDLGGRTLTPGVYCYTSSAQLTGTLTLDAQANPTGLFIFQVGTALTTASNSRVVLTNGAQACNVFWQLGSSATLGTATAFVGTLIALASETLNTGVTLAGRAIARGGAVTLDTNAVTACASTVGSTAIPTLSQWGVLILSVLMAITAVVVIRRRART